MQTESAISTSAPVMSPALSEEMINITPTAQAKIVELFDDVDDDIVGIRIFVSGGGCSGMTYGMTFTDRRTEYDRVLKGKDFDVYVDAVAFNFLDGVEIDFVDRGAGGASFVFQNVFAATGGSGMCGGCGGADDGGGGGGGCGG